jgi:hypothetical protein
LDEYRDIVRTMIRGKSGVYALYKQDKLYYVGLASNLMTRVNGHLKDRHHGAWDRFSVYLTNKPGFPIWLWYLGRLIDSRRPIHGLPGR